MHVTNTTKKYLCVPVRSGFIQQDMYEPDVKISSFVDIPEAYSTDGVGTMRVRVCQSDD